MHIDGGFLLRLIGALQIGFVFVFVFFVSVKETAKHRAKFG